MLKGRLEDDRMLTGRGKYVSDWNLPRQAYGHFVRSDRAHAEIVSINKNEATKHRGVLAVFTGEDIKGTLKSLPCALPVKGRGGMELIHPGRPALAQGRVRFAGDAVALVVAETAVAAHDAAELVAIEYRDRHAVVIAEQIGVGFGVRFNVYPEYCAALFASKKLDRPVKGTGTRSEVFLADEQARDVRSRGELALEAHGQILAMRFDMLANLSAYLAPTGPFINTIGIV